MLLVSPLFHSVDMVDGKIEAVFSLRENTDIEKAIEESRAGQEIQDGAIVELAEILAATFYVKRINNGLMTIEDVPTRWKEKVEAELNK